MPVDEDLELDTEQAPPPKKRSVVKIIMWSVISLLLVGGATAGGLYFAGMLPGFSVQDDGADNADASKDSKKKGVKGKGEKKKKDPEKPVIYHALEPPFVVNFQDQTQVRFLQISIEVSSRDIAVVEAVKTHMPVIRSNLILLLSSQNFSDISSREGKENLRASALDEINAILKERTGQAGVEDVYFTSFVMQ